MNPLSFIPAPWLAWVRIAAWLLVVGLVFGAGWKVEGALDAKEIGELKLEHSNAVLKATQTALAAQHKLDADHAALTAQLAAQSASYLEDLTRREREIDILRPSVAAGTRVVRVAGTCPAAAADLPQAAAGGRVDPAAGAVLAPNAGQRVLDLRAGAERFDAKLAACQAAVKCLTGQGACPAAPVSNPKE